MRELTIREMSVVGGGISVGDQIQGGTVVATGSVYTATQAAAVSSVLGVAVGVVGVGVGSFLLADAMLNDGAIFAQIQRELHGEDGDG
ncbi:hypothetical protein [Methylomonas methanica]|uniref:Uncharacterized protein n=1 Tax=Methylomonas methanica TaxID=421 RepID=A0A177MSK4_METMH|nr:hypothetical protein [Methylomonas methanica]OAI07819.1 hypothetical protein A1332_00020 [Methylomonas methanica]